MRYNITSLGGQAAYVADAATACCCSCSAVKVGIGSWIGEVETLYVCLKI